MKCKIVFAILLASRIGAGAAIFDWTPGGAPDSSCTWISSFDGDNSPKAQQLAGPDGTLQSLYPVQNGFTPYNRYAARLDEFTLCVYGSADGVSAAAGEYATLWCLGRCAERYEEADIYKTALVKNDAGEILLVQMTGVDTTTLASVNAGAVRGWHLFTVRFSSSGGASLQIDNGEIHTNAAMTQIAGKGFQLGRNLGTVSSPFGYGYGFIPLRFFAYDTASLDDAQYAALCETYPCAACKHSSTSAETTWVFPQDAARVDSSYIDAIELGAKAIVDTLDFGSTNAVSATMIASLPEGATGSLIGIVNKKDASEYPIYAKANGDGTFTIFYTEGGVEKKTDKSVSSGAIDVAALHVWTLAYDASSGARLYCDGALVASDAGIKWTGANLHKPAGEVSFGAISGAKVYAVHTDFGADSTIFDTAANAAKTVLQSFDFMEEFAGEDVAAQLSMLAMYIETGTTTTEVTHDCVLRISEIMPKPTDSQSPGEREGMDVNGLESGWVEVENTSSKWADLADYRFIRTNRGKKTDPAGSGNFPSRLVPPHSRAVFYTSERYPNSDAPEESAFQHGTFDAAPAIYPELGDILVWGKKVNPKKFPYVRLYYAPGGEIESVVDTVVIPSDIPEGWSIITGDAADGEATRRWLCPAPTRAAANPATGSLTRLGPNVGPLYEKKGQKKTDIASEFDRIAPPAVPGEDYVITLPVNPVMNPDGSFTPRAADAISSIRLVYRTDLDDATLATNDVDMATLSSDENWGNQYTASIPHTAFPAAGHLIQWKVLIEDGEGNVWTSPSFNNPDDGYEWYGTIVEPDSSQTSATLPTWHMFADAASLAQMDVDASKQSLPNNARVAIYDSSTSNYYDYVRIDLRGNTSARFTKKGHGLRFAKAHPLTMTDIVTGETIEEIRKTSLISEFADPSYMRQMIAFWLWRKMGNLAPFDFPVRCNMNGEFFQLAFNSERFTDELIEDVYGLDKFGYSYKNVGTLKSGTGTTAGDIEKKTPDDENETDISVLQNELRKPLYDNGAQSGGEDVAALTKFVVEKFNLPAWLNYLASARITQEMDDVWANVCIYYDNAQMTEGVRGTGTWMPLGYDFNLSFGQYYRDSGVGGNGLFATNDWYKSHPFYGGNRVRCYTSEARTSTINSGNDGFEAVWQSAKFRRLYLRRLRTLMDAELKAPGVAESDVPFMAKMREMADLMRADAALDAAKWPNDSSDNSIDAWLNITRPADMDAGIDDIWENYVVPRRLHLYNTHSATNTAFAAGYGTLLNAGIPEAQSPIAELAPNIAIANLTALDPDAAATLGIDSQFYDTEVVEIYNGNDEAVDMSGWRLAFSVEFVFPAGAVCDANDSIFVTADRRAYIAARESELTDQVIVGNATFTGAGPIALYDDAGALVFSKIPETDERRYLRLHSFCGNTADGADGDTGEYFTLTNISNSATLDLAGVTVCFLKQGDPETKDHCHVTLENKKGKGSIAPLASWTALQADYAGKGWVKIQNNKQAIAIYDKYGSVCQSLKVTQKNFALAYGLGGFIVCDSTDAAVASDSAFHQSYLLAPGEATPAFAAKSQAAADAIAAGLEMSLSADDAAGGYLRVCALPQGDGTYAASIAVNPETVPVPEFSAPIGLADGVLTIEISNAVKGLWYGCESTLSLADAFAPDAATYTRATGGAHTIEVPLPAAPAAFYRVVPQPAEVENRE